MEMLWFSLVSVISVSPAGIHEAPLEARFGMVGGLLNG
jgi:hypothetical protein